MMFDDARIKELKEDFNKLRYGFSKLKIKEIRKNLYDIKNPKILFKSKTKEIEQNTIELEERFFKLNKYYDYDDTEYQGIRDVANLFNGIVFNQSINEDYYKPIWTKCVFNGNYIKYESKGGKDKNLSPKEQLNMIRPYLSDMIINYKTQGEWEIQLEMSINFISSDDSDETRNLCTKSNNRNIMMGVVTHMK